MSTEEIQCPYCGTPRRSTYSLSTWETHKNRCYLIHKNLDALIEKVSPGLLLDAMIERVTPFSTHVLIDCLPTEDLCFSFDTEAIRIDPAIVHLSPEDLRRIYPDGLQEIQEHIKGKSLCSSLQEAAGDRPGPESLRTTQHGSCGVWCIDNLCRG